MKALTVKDLTVPLSEYATVSLDATLYDAVIALEQAHAVDQSHYRHRAVLVFDQDNMVIGKLGLFDILTALESKYSRVGDLQRLAGLGLSPRFIQAVSGRSSFWSQSLKEVVDEAARLPVSGIMHVLRSEEYIEEGAPLDEAIHQLLMGHYQSLIVTQGREVTGILKASDIFREVCLMIQGYDKGESASS